MKKAIGSVAATMVLLLVVGLAATPTFAAELRVTGFFDNVFPYYGFNMSGVDQDTTRNDEGLLGTFAQSLLLQLHRQR